jgi:hypothetical protein
MFERSRTEFTTLAGEEIIQIFYAPHKAFRKIVKDAKFIGPIVILILFVVMQVGASYVVASKSYLEQTVPTSDQGDYWVENTALWAATPNTTITNNYFDYINSTSLYLNTTSLEFSTNDSNSIEMILSNLGGSVDCSASGYQNLFLRVKVVSPTAVPQNVTLTLFTLSPAMNFAYDLSPAFSNATLVEQHLWNNLTVPLNTNAWTASNSAATWSNITGMRLGFTWSNSSSIDLRLDGLFFGGVYKTSLDIYGSSVLFSTALSAATPFLFEWLLLTGLIYVLIKGLKGSVVWKPVMVAVGFALATLIVQSVILLVIYSSSALPNIFYPVAITAGIPGESNSAYAIIDNAISQVLTTGSIVQIIIYIWVIALGTFIVREVTAVAPPTPMGTPAPENEPMLGPQQFGWLKSLLVSAVAFVVTVTILGFLGIA